MFTPSVPSRGLALPFPVVAPVTNIVGRSPGPHPAARSRPHPNTVAALVHGRCSAPVGEVFAPSVMPVRPSASPRLHAGGSQKQPARSAKLASPQRVQRSVAQALSLRDQSVTAAVLPAGDSPRVRDVGMPEPEVEAPVPCGAKLDVRGPVLSGRLARRSRCAKQHKSEQWPCSSQATHFCFSSRPLAKVSRPVR